MQLLSRPRRQRRAGEWSGGKTVTFIVTLAATRSVTLAAREAGMSRKSAYALKARDRGFAEAWVAALKTRPPTVRRLGEVEEVEAAPIPLAQGNNPTLAGYSISSSKRVEGAALRRDRFFAAFRQRSSESARLARSSLGQ